MYYMTDCQYKTSMRSADPSMAKHKLVDAEIIPAIKHVAGVRSVHGYCNKPGHLTLVMDIQDLATIDRMLADQMCQVIFDRLNITAVRAGSGMPTVACILRRKLKQEIIKNRGAKRQAR